MSLKCQNRTRLNFVYSESFFPVIQDVGNVGISVQLLMRISGHQCNEF